MSDVENYLKKHKEKKEREKKVQEQKRRAAQSACEIFSGDSGKEFLRWLMAECGYQKPSVIYNHEDGEVRIQSTVYNEAKRDIYLRVRLLLSSRPDILASVENNIKGEKDG